jgi:lysozyme
LFVKSYSLPFHGQKGLRMNINQATIDLVKRFEGLRLKAYLDPVGIPTIGYGLTSRANIGVDVVMGMTITEAQAEEYLARVLRNFANEILPHFTRKPTENQFGAMLSLAYNIGTGAFSRSTCLRRFNAGDIDGAAEALTWFSKAGGRVLPGLVRRRAAERELFLSDNHSEVVTPKADPERGRHQSTTMQAAVGASLAGGGGVVTAVSQLEGAAQLIVIGAACVAALFLLWISKERLRKWAAGDR